MIGSDDYSLKLRQLPRFNCIQWTIKKGEDMKRGVFSARIAAFVAMLVLMASVIAMTPTTALGLENPCGKCTDYGCSGGPYHCCCMQCGSVHVDCYDIYLGV